VSEVPISHDIGVAVDPRAKTGKIKMSLNHLVGLERKKNAQKRMGVSQKGHSSQSERLPNGQK